MKEEEKELQAFAIARDGIGVILLSTVQNPTAEYHLELVLPIFEPC